jgi:prepilin-type N-terminal cleavage/methylation domain-containing protein
LYLKKNIFFSSRGFTLIEIIVVVALIAILSTIILPDFKGSLRDYKLNFAARQMAQNIKLVQQKAMSEGIPWRVVFESSRNCYRINQGFKSWKQINLPDGVEFAYIGFSEKTLTFYPSGAAVPAGSIKITNRDKSLYVIVSVATGRVRISENPP